jgi:hypothetical protein
MVKKICLISIALATLAIPLFGWLGRTSLIIVYGPVFLVAARIGEGAHAPDAVALLVGIWVETFVIVFSLGTLVAWLLAVVRRRMPSGDQR